jgi:hypothetical protein
LFISDEVQHYILDVTSFLSLSINASSDIDTAEGGKNKGNIVEFHLIGAVMEEYNISYA